MPPSSCLAPLSEYVLRILSVCSVFGVLHGEPSRCLAVSPAPRGCGCSQDIPELEVCPRQVVEGTGGSVSWIWGKVPKVKGNLSL